MAEKLDLDALERALIGSAMGLTFRECQTLIKYARALESRASNAGGAVAYMRPSDGALLHAESREMCGFRRAEWTPLYTHPAPASKEPVADERAMVRGVPKSIINAITAYGDARADSKDTGEAIGNAVSAIRAALATAQTPWIPFGARFPDDCETVLVYGHVKGDTTKQKFVTYAEHWDGEFCGDDPLVVSHWMPYPDPPAAAPAKPEGV